jgi:starch-binding outer membrane protein, SusD/RagB family
MKNIKILFILLLTTSIFGCKKFLNQQPITDLGAEAVFTDVPNTLKALASVYSRLIGDAGYGIRLSLYYTVDTDEMQGPTGNTDNDRRDIARYGATPGNAQIFNPFNQIFQGIEYANICISNIPKMDMYINGSETEKKQLQRMYGEALTLRAQFYFEAIKNWGDLPASYEPAAAAAAANPFPVRTDRNIIYDKLLNDLALAATLVPWRNELAAIGDGQDERITKGAVKGLRARIALFRGGYSLKKDGTTTRSADYLTYYTMAKNECNDIINSGQHSLNPSYKALWKDQVGGHTVADPNGELMFQVSAIGASSAADSKLGYYNGPTVTTAANVTLGNRSINVLPSYFYIFDSTDTRRDVTCAPYNLGANGQTKVGQAITAINDGKFRRDWTSNPAMSPTSATQYLGLKWQLIRYSDVLLMYAETENELNGPTASAYSALNQVRRRGYNKSISTPDATVDIAAGLSKDDFFKVLVRERSLELGGEGVRKFDLIRWNLLTAALAETKANLLKMSTVGTSLLNPTYMAGYPSYSLVNNLPAKIYFLTTSTSDNLGLGAGLVVNSFYKPSATTTPAGTTGLTWISAAINTTALARFATNYDPSKTQLLPIPQTAKDANINMYQNFGY